MAYSQAHLGSIQVKDAAAIDDVFGQMRTLEFDRTDEETGELAKAKLNEYQVRGGTPGSSQLQARPGMSLHRWRAGIARPLRAINPTRALRTSPALPFPLRSSRWQT